MLRFIQFLICEREEENVTSTIKTHIRRILELLVQASTPPDSSFEDRVAKEGTVLSELDLLEALDILHQVTKSRLTSTKEWRADPKAGYKQLFKSIREEVKEALRLNFRRVGQTGIGFLMLHFMKQVVDPIFTVLQKVGPEQANTEVDSLVNEASDHIKNLTRRFHSDDAMVAKKLLIAHDRLTTQLQKKATPTKEDRLRVIKKVAQKFSTRKQEEV